MKTNRQLVEILKGKCDFVSELGVQTEWTIHLIKMMENHIILYTYFFNLGLEGYDYRLR